jgi:hypothetical protein
LSRRFESLLGHLSHHSVKEWLLRGTKMEDANTIRAAVKRIPESELIAGLAVILAPYHPNYDETE